MVYLVVDLYRSSCRNAAKYHQSESSVSSPDWRSVFAELKTLSQLYYRCAVIIFFSLLVIYWIWFPIAVRIFTQMWSCEGLLTAKQAAGNFQSTSGVFDHYYNGINNGNVKQASDGYAYLISILFVCIRNFIALTRGWYPIGSLGVLWLWRFCSSGGRDTACKQGRGKGNVDVDRICMGHVCTNADHDFVLYSGFWWYSCWYVIVEWLKIRRVSNGRTDSDQSFICQ